MAQRRGKRAGQAAQDLDTIREVYARGGGGPRGLRWRLSANINHAVKVAGFNALLGRADFPTKYEQAHRALAVMPKYGAIQAVRYVCEQIRAVWERPVGAPADDEYERPRRAPKRARRPSTYRINILSEEDEIIGYVPGESVSAEEAALTLKVGDPAAAWVESEDRATAGRVVAAADARTFTLRTGRHEEHTFVRLACDWAGRVTGPCSRLSGEQQTRLDQPRQRLDAVDADDITNSTAAMKIEKEIFDILHPAGEGEDLNDWSEW